MPTLYKWLNAEFKASDFCDSTRKISLYSSFNVFFLLVVLSIVTRLILNIKNDRRSRTGSMYSHRGWPRL